MSAQPRILLCTMAVVAGASLCSAAVSAEEPAIRIGDASLVRPTASAKPMEFKVSRTGALGSEVTLSYETHDRSAVAGVDYTAQRGTLVIPADATQAKIRVPIRPGRAASTRNFVVDLKAANGPLEDDAVLHSFPAGTDPSSLAVADFNRDGKADVVVAEPAADRVSVLLNTTSASGAAPTLAAAVSFAAGNVPGAVVTGDFNGDGKPDIAVVNPAESQTQDAVSVLLNTTATGAATPTFAAPKKLPAGKRPDFLTVADFNGDGKPDLAVVNRGVPAPGGAPAFVQQGFSVFLNTTAQGATTAGFAAHKDFDLSDPVLLVAADLNGDGKPDLAVRSIFPRNQVSSTSLFLNTTANGAAAPSFGDAQALDNEFNADFLATGDVNNDGLPDLVTRNLVLINDTAAGKTPADFKPGVDVNGGPGASSSPLALADLNVDGWPDLVASDESGALTVLLNRTASSTSTPEFAAPVEIAPPITRDASLAADLNGDGRPELLGINAETKTVSVRALEFGPVDIVDGRGKGSILPNVDTRPDPFHFTDVAGVSRKKVVTSSPVVIAGINSATAITVSGGSYSINGGAFTTVKGTVRNGDRVRARHTASGAFSTAVSTRVTIGGVSDDFTSTTKVGSSP
ncbi:MAG: FG-GAP-like repeat-containing protein [Panacagrimonas sp.]